MTKEEALQIITDTCKICDDKLREACSFFIPELKKSDDDRIKNELIAFVEQSIHRGGGTPIPQEQENKWIAWLEKQGEQKTAADLKTWRNIVDEVLTRFVGIGQYLDSSRATTIAKNLQKKYSLEQSANITDDWIEDYWQHEKVNNPDSYDKGEEIQFDHQGFVNFCRKYCQKPAEWSGEDSNMLNRIIMTLAGFSYFGGMEVSYVIDWLKSLRPHNWTEEDKERYISCLQRLSTGNPKQPETINTKWFKEHVYPQNKWKPTPSQLSALEKAANDYALSCDELARLSELYEQLKKL